MIYAEKKYLLLWGNLSYLLEMDVDRVGDGGGGTGVAIL